jgi:hypothetical protein
MKMVLRHKGIPAFSLPTEASFASRPITTATANRPVSQKCTTCLRGDGAFTTAPESACMATVLRISAIVASRHGFHWGIKRSIGRDVNHHGDLTCAVTQSPSRRRWTWQCVRTESITKLCQGRGRSCLGISKGFGRIC